MKNILFIASDNAKTSGAFLCMVKLCELLKKNYNCNVIVVLPGIGDGKPLLDEIGVKTYMVKSCTWAVPNEWNKLTTFKFGLKMWLYNIPAQRQIREIIRQEKIDIVHMNTTWTYVGAKAALKEQVKLVWHLREALEEDQNRHIISKPQGYQLINRADRIITVSDFIFDKYKNIVDNGLLKIYEGLDEVEFYQKREIFTNPVVNILCIGLIVEKKGQWQVIEAGKYLIDRGITNFKVSIVGRGSSEYLRSLRERINQYGLNNHIFLCGSTSKPSEYYEKSDIMIMSSTAEAFGRTTVEGLMEGCLVIGANAGATPALLDYGNAGILYEYGNIEELTEKIIYAIHNQKQMRQLALEGQKFAYNNFTATKNAQLVYDVYQELN